MFQIYVVGKFPQPKSIGLKADAAMDLGKLLLFLADHADETIRDADWNIKIKDTNHRNSSGYAAKEFIAESDEKAFYVCESDPVPWKICSCEDAFDPASGHDVCPNCLN